MSEVIKDLKTIVVYGKENCPFCKQAKDLAYSLATKYNIDVLYIDIVKNNITKEILAEKLNLDSVSTVPQVQFVFNNEANKEKYIGGFTEFRKYVIEHNL